MEFDFNLVMVLAAVGGLLGFGIARLIRAKIIRTKITPKTKVQVGEVLAVPVPVAAPIAVQAPQKAATLGQGLGKTTKFLQSAIDRLFTGQEGEAFYQDLEETLLSADVGITLTENIVNELRKIWGLKRPNRQELAGVLNGLMANALPELPIPAFLAGGASQGGQPHVIMMVGINGVGKTTTVGKLAHRYVNKGQKVVVGAADTFRAAATDQLRQWVDRAGAEGIFQKDGADPSAVAFDTVQAAVARKADLCLVDTAGRLHTKQNLMYELQKMKRVMGKAQNGAPHDVWLTVDGATGQNAVNQAVEFHKALGLTGIVVTKLDGTAKGGVLLSVVNAIGVPVILVGVGEGVEDLISFDRQEYLKELLAGLRGT